MDDRTAALVIRTLGAPPPPAVDPRDTTVALADAVAWLRAVQIAETFAHRRRRRRSARSGRTTASVRHSTQHPGADAGRRDGVRHGLAAAHGPGAAARAAPVHHLRRYHGAPVGELAAERPRTATPPSSGFTRGKACSPDQPVPYVHDGADAAALIDWISRQPWSDGRVGMYGGSYSGMTPWAAAKRGAAGAQGDHGRRAGGAGAGRAHGRERRLELRLPVALLYHRQQGAGRLHLQRPGPLEPARNRRGTSSGRAYRDLDKIDGTPNPVWDEWLAHPAYDAYWQDMIPYGSEFARIRIPVLQTAGYYFGGPGAAIHYFTEHYKLQSARRALPGDRARTTTSRPSAAWSTRWAIPRPTSPATRSIPAPRIDIVGDLRYQWFDYVLKGKPRAGAAGGQGELRGGGREPLEARAFDRRDGERRAALLSERRAGAIGLPARTRTRSAGDAVGRR